MPRTITTRKRRTPAQWASLLSRFERSGLSVSAFCAQESISVANFYRQRGLHRTIIGDRPRFPGSGMVDQIRGATNGNYALGNERFASQVSETQGRRATAGRSGRPRQSIELESGELF